MDKLEARGEFLRLMVRTYAKECGATNPDAVARQAFEEWADNTLNQQSVEGFMATVRELSNTEAE